MVKKIWVILLVLGVIGIGIGWGQDFIRLKLIWDANTEPDLAGYKVYNGQAPRVYSNVVNVGNVTEHESQVNAQVKTHFAVTAYDNAGNESGYSNEAVYYPGMFVVDTVYCDDSQVCVKLNETTNFTWKVTGTIEGTSFEVNSYDAEFCAVLPVTNDWVTVTFHLEVYNLNGDRVFMKDGTFEVPLTGDFDGNGEVGLSDLYLFAQSFGNPAKYFLAADFNRDNKIALFDLYEFAQRFGRQ